MVYLTQGIVLGLYAAILPGPFQAFMLSKSLQNGWRRTLPLAFVPLLTDLPVMLLMLGLLAQVPAWLMDYLRFAGGIYLLYLAWNTLQRYKASADPAGNLPQSSQRGFFQSIMINYLNPNVYIFWGTVGVPIILEGLESSTAQGISFILGFYITLVIALAVIIFSFGSVGQLNPRVQRFLGLFLTLLLFSFGGYMIWQSVTIWIA